MLKVQVFYAFLARLSKREKLIFYGAIFVIFLTVLDRLIIYPVSSKLGFLDKEIETKEADIKKNLRILAQENKILSESAKYGSFLTAFKSEEEETTSFLKEIENLANKSSVYLVDMKPAGLKEAGLCKKYLVNLNCEAQMEQVFDFMYNIENSNKLTMVEKYQISPKSKESSIAKCSITISKIVIP